MALFPLRKSIGLPIQVHINLTDRCPLKCRICDIWKKEGGNELSTTDWKRIIDGIVRWVGPLSINFSGGEPLLRKDIFDIIEYCTDRGITTTLNTNGILLNRDKIRLLNSAGLDILYISLDGIKEETHDYIRGEKGVFKRVFSTIDDGLDTPPMRIVLAVVINRLNIAEIPAMVEFAKRRGYQIVFQPLFQNFGQDLRNDWFKECEFFPHRLDELDEVMDLLIEEKRNDGPVCNSVEHLYLIKGYFRNPDIPNGLPCNAGNSDFAIDPYGNFLLCYNLRPVGNIMKSNCERLWFSDSAFRLRKEIARCKRTCNILNCNYPRLQ